ncbi:hypothetical protein DICVIV_13563 [Dictyocaulus viviparus]|uniref:Peptidase M1 membrane alanine aminopeptidase domain-containing protein n=1 Tax=Dictyocaulus viviparus TaxID=29172 RepID=A0A0D8XA19_DICVI|nr:hypothetical protein DICVIV_13563 [Dictyocaulus viviparus]
METLETLVGEEYMLTVIRDLLLTKTSLNLTSFTRYFENITIDYNISLAQAYKFWFTTGGFPAVKVSRSTLGYELEQLGRVIWPLRLSSDHPLPLFFLSKTITLPSYDEPLLINLNFTSFMRVNYDSVMWMKIFSLMDEHLEQFSAVGRAQLVNDFCYFYAHNDMHNGKAVKEMVVDMVYRNAEFFELCDWHLLWCHSTPSETLTNSIRRLAMRKRLLFEIHNTYGCRTGLSVRNSK